MRRSDGFSSPQFPFTIAGRFFFFLGGGGGCLPYDSSGSHDSFFGNFGGTSCGPAQENRVAAAAQQPMVRQCEPDEIASGELKTASFCTAE